jgi:hypothetical protein
MKKILVNNGEFEAKVDDVDYGTLSKHKWYLTGHRYAGTSFQRNRVKHYMYMHRAIMGANEGEVVDHINGNCLDNRRDNLRICNNSQNGLNAKKPKNNSTGEKCVYFNKARKKWYVRTRVNSKDMFRGYFKTFDEAVSIRDEIFSKHHGEFARTN